jgi:hypothetical protein
MTRGPTRFLLPHERWLVPRILGSQQKRRTTAVVGMEKKYGPDGMVWLDASLANAPFSIITTLVVVVIVFAHPTRTSKIGLYLLVVAAVFWALNIVRLLQAARAGRRFRREHP